ncbi:MAG: hypothetical protein WBA24_06780 [Geitlerinemataceae cyanobacterium]
MANSKSKRLSNGWVERQTKVVRLKSGYKLYYYFYYRYEIWENGKLVKTPSIQIQGGKENAVIAMIKQQNLSVSQILECRPEWGKPRKIN